MTFSGRVPGCVHTDLLREGRIKDPYWRDQSEKCRWIENWNWAYETTLSVEENEREGELVFEGLDTYAAVYVNGTLAGRAENMFIPHVFPVRLKGGENTVRVVFTSPIARTNGLPLRGAAFTAERLHTRRLQCTYSWDWVDRFVTMGIYKSACFIPRDDCRIEDLMCETRHVDRWGAELYCRAKWKGQGENLYLRLRLDDPEGRTVYENRRRAVEDAAGAHVDVPEPRLWWPNGYGDQPLYTLSASLETENGETLDKKTIRVGIRTVRVLERRDAPGSEEERMCLALKRGAHVSGDNAFWDRNEPGEFSGFTVVVNGEKVFCKGANWVPCEPFPSEETPEKIRLLLSLMRDAHANMVRVWGGGLFEQDAFYDACDEMGLMVTQDFLMACGHYPEDEDWFLEELKKEARCAALRLRSHACLAWWSGDNENAMDADEDMEDYHGRRSALRAIGPVLEELDPNRLFLPSSPYGGRPYGSITRGTTHNTNYIGQMFSYIRFHDMRDYQQVFDGYLSRFCAEEPAMGMPQMSSMRRFLSEEDILGPDEGMMRFHTKNNPSPEFREFEIYDYMCAIADKVLGEPLCPADRIAKRQYIQYEWIRLTMEQYRRRKWFSSGMVYWMLDDCWPGIGWAIVDYYARPKAAWYGFRTSGQRVIGSIVKEEGEYRLIACCDGREGFAGKARMFVQPFDSAAPRMSREVEFTIPANGRQAVLSVNWPGAGKGEILLAEIEGGGLFHRTCCFEARPRDCGFPGEAPRVVEVGEDYVVLTAHRYVHAVCLDGDAVYGDNFFSMLPGETRKVTFRRDGDGPLTLRALGSAEDTVSF